MLKHFELPSVADDLRTSEEGQTMAEYGVVLAVITAAIFVALGFLSGAIAGALDKVTAMLYARDERRTKEMTLGRSEITAERGQTMAEYAVILGVVTIAIVTSFGFLAAAIEAALQRALDVIGLA